MKIERLYAITVYLMNHGRTSAGELAKHFEVSLRTIQRDIDSLCLSGIPIIAFSGAAGGYEISDRFQIDSTFATPDDYSYIVTALKGLIAATADRKAKHTLEKIVHASPPAEEGIILDFSVLREGGQAALQMLQTAAARKHVVRFTYTNNNGETRTHSVEPIAVVYRWYAWYLLAYSRVKNDYRTYKLVRMQDLEISEQTFTKKHAPAGTILQEMEKTDARQYTDILLRCKGIVISRAIEYLKGTVVEEFPNGDALMKLTVVENEHFWLGTLLSFGDHAEILEPRELRDRLKDAALKIVSLYQ